MSDRRASVTVRISGRPSSDGQTFETYSRGRTYRLQNVTLDAKWDSGNWSYSWKATGPMVKKDGTDGEHRASTKFGWRPDAETERQFKRAAMKAARFAAIDEANA